METATPIPANASADAAPLWLNLLPGGRLTPERAAKWLHEDLDYWFELLGTMLLAAGQRAGESLTCDLAEMSKAGAQVLVSGEPLDLEPEVDRSVLRDLDELLGRAKEVVETDVGRGSSSWA